MRVRDRYSIKAARCSHGRLLLIMLVRNTDDGESFLRGRIVLFRRLSVNWIHNRIVFFRDEAWKYKGLADSAGDFSVSLVPHHMFGYTLYD